MQRLIAKNKIPLHKEGLRLLDFEGNQSAANWVDVTSTGDFTITDNPRAGVVGSENGLKYTQNDDTATRLVRAYLSNPSGWDCSKSDVWTLAALWEELPSRWRAGTNGAIELTISSDAAPGTFTNYKLITLLNGVVTGLVTVGKNAMSWTNADWTGSGGTIDYSSIKNIRLRFNTASAKDSVTFTGFWNGRKSNSMVAVTFDDANAGDVAAAATANSYGVPFTSFIIPEFIDQGSSMTLADVKTIASNPLNAICGHNDNTLWDDTEDSGMAEVANTVAWLKEHGYDWQYYAYPGGGFNSDVWNVMRANGIVFARTLRGISYTAGPPTQYASRVSYEGVSTQVDGIPDPLQVNASPLNNSMTLAQSKTALDTAIKKGESIIFYGHKLGGATDSITWLTTDFDALMAYIKLKQDQGLIEAVNIPQFYKKNSGIRPS
jgi:hypothetical protein